MRMFYELFIAKSNNLLQIVKNKILFKREKGVIVKSK